MTAPPRQARQARELPEAWNKLVGDNLYLRREFLEFLEDVDPCGQRYAWWTDPQGEVDTLCMSYQRRRFNLLMFTPLRVALTATFIYVPLSVTRPGLVSRGGRLADAAAWLTALPGLKVALNLPPGQELPGFVRTTTFPRCVLDLRWKSMRDYLDDLRSGYRRRALKALRLAAPLTFRELEPREFGPGHYHLYEEVFEASPYRIEKLSLAFFQGPFARLIVAELQSRPVGFIQLIENGGELIFEFVGFDHGLNARFDIYHALLLRIVEEGITGGFTRIDFGQTADEAKLRLGCRYEPLHAWLHHSNPLLNLLLRKFIDRIGYQPLPEDQFHVFRQAAPDPTAPEDA